MSDFLQDAADIRILDGDLRSTCPILRRAATLLAAALAAPRGALGIAEANSEADTDVLRGDRFHGVANGGAGPGAVGGGFASREQLTDALVPHFSSRVR